MSFKGELITSLGWNWNDGAVDNDQFKYAKILNTGDGVNQAEGAWHSESRELVSGESDLFDLSALTRIVLNSQLVTRFARVKALQIINLSTEGGLLIIGGAVCDPWWEPFGDRSDTVQCPLDSSVFLSNRRTGWPVTALGSSSSSSSGEDSLADRFLKVAAVGGDVTYSIAIIGTLRD